MGDALANVANELLVDGIASFILAETCSLALQIGSGFVHPTLKLIAMLSVIWTWKWTPAYLGLGWKTSLLI